MVPVYKVIYSMCDLYVHIQNIVSVFSIHNINTHICIHYINNERIKVYPQETTKRESFR